MTIQIEKTCIENHVIDHKITMQSHLLSVRTTSYLHYFKIDDDLYAY